MNSNNFKDNIMIEDHGSKTYRKPTKELVRDQSKTNLAVKLSKHNRNNSYDISKNEKEKKTVNSIKESVSGSNNQLQGNNPSTNNLNANNFNNQNHMPYFNNINIFAANMNNFRTGDLNVKQFVINKLNKTKLTQGKQRSVSAAKN